MAEDVFVPIGLFGMIVGIVWLVSYFNSKKRKEVHDTLRASIEKGVELSPDLVESIFYQPDAKTRDLRRGWVWLSVGLACLFISWRMGTIEPDAGTVISALASLPAFIGLAFLGFGFLGYGRKAS